MAGSIGGDATISEDTTHPPFAATTLDEAGVPVQYMEIE
jgi:hypothetical protein